MAQSVLSAYESGRRQPALPMLARLIEATGLELRVTVDEPHRGPLSGPVGAKIDLVPATDLKLEIRDRVEREALPLWPTATGSA